MAIIGLQRRIREVGRIRMGDQGVSANGKSYPRKANKFRLSSADRTVIEAAAGIYGGTAKPWDNQGNRQWEVYTEADQLRIALPPDPRDLGFSQWLEHWGNKVCTRRCDGERETINDTACSCDPEDRECKPTTRLSMFLPDVPGLGVWRLETHGINAAMELNGALDIIEAMAGIRSIVPARLRLDQREQRKLVNGKPETRKFAVPVIDLDVSIMAVRSVGVGGSRQVELAPVEDDAPTEDGWQPINQAETVTPPALSLESQLKEIEQPKAKAPRKNAATPLKPTGVPVHKASNLPGTTCDICSKPYGAEPLTKNPNPGGSKFVHKACLGSVAPVVEQPVLVDPPHFDAQPEASATTTVIGSAMSPGQHKKIMALTANVFPVEAGTPADVVRTIRREKTLALCEVLGMPPMESRSDLNTQQANLLIDALTKLESGELEWDDQLETLTPGKES